MKPYLILTFAAALPFAALAEPVTAAKDAEAAPLARTTSGEVKNSEAPKATGKVFSITPAVLSVTTPGSAVPMEFQQTGETPIVDEDGKAVSRDLIRKGLPITVQYETSDDVMTATSIIVTRAMAEGDTGKMNAKEAREAVAEMTEESKEAAASDAIPTSGSLNAVVSGSERTLLLRVSGSDEPQRVAVTGATELVDKDGSVVSSGMVESGLPVTVHYVKNHGTMIANRIVLSMTATPEMMKQFPAMPAGENGSAANESDRSGGTTDGPVDNDGIILNGGDPANANGRTNTGKQTNGQPRTGQNGTSRGGDGERQAGDNTNGGNKNTPAPADPKPATPAPAPGQSSGGGGAASGAGSSGGQSSGSGNSGGSSAK